MNALVARRRSRWPLARGSARRVPWPPARRRARRAPSPRLLVGLGAAVTGALGLYRLMRGADAGRTYAPEPDRLPNEPDRPVSPTSPPGGRATS